MSGVIDARGVQWEHCNGCGCSTRLDNLGYEPPSPEHEHGRDLCLTCTNASPYIMLIQPAESWQPVYDTAVQENANAP